MSRDDKPVLTIRVYHDTYGCDTGCCGHTAVVSRGPDRHSKFYFAHCGERDDTARAAWARELVEQRLREYFPECVDTVDWSTLDIEEIDTCQ